MWWALVKNKRLAFLLLLVLAASCNSKNKADKAKLYLASSMAVMLEDIEKQALGHIAIDIMFLTSSAIARQVAEGAPCDAAILADEQWQNYLAEKNVVEPDKKLLAKNSLVLVGPKKYGTKRLEDAFKNFPSGQKLIVGDADYVPLGAYTKEALVKLGWYEKLKHQLLPTHSARQASLLLSQGAANFAILYKTDAVPKSVQVVAFIDPALHRPIAYPFVVCKKGKAPHIKALVRLFFSTEFKSAMKAKGFSVSPLTN